jgi:HSP20 family protein
MVEDNNMTSPHMRMWQFSRCALGGMDNILKTMEDLMEQDFKNLSESMSRNYVRETKLPNGSVEKRWGPFVYGYSMTVGPDGKPQIREFGNMKPDSRMGRPHLDIKDKREPLADLVTTDCEVQVIIELPGVAKDEIKLRGTEDSLTASVDTSERSYYKKLELPARVDPKTAKSKYTNGILEVTLKKLEDKAPEGEIITIH